MEVLWLWVTMLGSVLIESVEIEQLWSTERNGPVLLRVYVNSSSMTTTTNAHRLADTYNWVNGPFTSRYEVELSDSGIFGTNCLSTDSTELENRKIVALINDGIYDAVTCTQLPVDLVENPIKLVHFWSERYRPLIEFTLESSQTDPTKSSLTLDVFWVHSRGNARLVRVGALSTEHSLLQNTRSGHFFLFTTPFHWPQEDSLDLPVDEFPWNLVQMAFLVPAVKSEENQARLLCRLKEPQHPLNNSPLLLYNTQLLVESYTSNIQESSSNSSATNISIRDLVLHYWEQQRSCQVHVNSWALPSLVPDSVDAAVDLTLSTNTLYTRFPLPQLLTTELSTAYSRSVYTASQQEPIISMVFNQLSHPTYYSPLISSTAPSLLQQLEDYILQKTALWTRSNVFEWEITGVYACREYRRGAIVRWHVDPVETQPITAIIHVAHGMRPDATGDVCLAADCSSQEANCCCHSNHSSVADSSSAWPLQLPKILTGKPSDLDASNLEHINLQIGEVLLLQSAKLPHARLLPLQEHDFYTNAFVHLRPRDPAHWTERYDVDILSSH